MPSKNATEVETSRPCRARAVAKLAFMCPPRPGTQAQAMPYPTIQVESKVGFNQ